MAVPKSLTIIARKVRLSVPSRSRMRVPLNPSQDLSSIPLPRLTSWVTTTVTERPCSVLRAAPMRRKQVGRRPQLLPAVQSGNKRRPISFCQRLLHPNNNELRISGENWGDQPSQLDCR